MSRIHVTIDRLAMAGLDAGDRHAFVASLRSELARVLADPATRSDWAHSHRTPSVRMRGISFDGGANGARKLGSQVAKGIGRGLKP